MLVLLDQSTPVPIRRFLTEHIVETASHRGWDKLRNGDLLKAAQDAGFQVLLTPDKNIPFQQNLKNYKIAVVVLGSGQWPLLRQHVHRVVAAVNAAQPAPIVKWRFQTDNAPRSHGSRRASPYSLRNATIGSTRIALRAGTAQATNATNVSIAMTLANTSGSSGRTP